MLGAHVHDSSCFRAIELVTVKTLELFLDLDGHTTMLSLLANRARLHALLALD